jgi:ABC-2 type transport system permease protein
VPRLSSAFRSLIRKETLHILRDRRTLAVLLLMPLVQVLLFGYALRTDVGEVRLSVVGPSLDEAGRSLLRELDASESIEVVGYSSVDAGVDGQFRRGDVDAALLLPAGFGPDLRRGGAELLVLYDGLDPTRGRTIQAYVAGAIRSWERERYPVRPAGVVVPVTRMRFNPTLASANLFVPGLLAFVLTIVSALMTAITIARERETGTMEVLLVSPVRPAQVVVAKVLPYVGLAFFNAVTTLIVARIAFDVALRGSVLLLLAQCALYVLVALALGVLVSSRAKDQRTAMMAVLLGMMLPTMLLSGFIFPISSLPPLIQPLTNVVPTTWFIVIARGIMLKGVGMEVLWEETLILAGMAVVLLGLSARNVRERLE